jgi:hypothetical protein
MMKKISSFKKVEANRANALKSTGPKTKFGKQKSKMNAVKYGVYASNNLLEGEDRKLFKAVEAEQLSRYHPKTFVEKTLVEQLVNELWGLRRIARAERLFGRDVQTNLPPPSLTNKERRLFKIMKTSPDALSKEFSEEVLGLNDKADEESLEPTTTQKKLRIYRAIEEKFDPVDRLDEVYLDIYLSTSQDQMQKIISLKRNSLQTILAIERELDRRKAIRAREKGNGETEII